MGFEQRPADVFVELVGEVIIKVLEPFLQHVARSGLVYTVDKQVVEPLEGVLIHGVDGGQVQDAEEQQARSKCNWSITVSNYVDLVFSHFAVFHSLVNFLGKLLTRLQLDN